MRLLRRPAVQNKPSCSLDSKVPNFQESHSFRPLDRNSPAYPVYDCRIRNLVRGWTRKDWGKISRGTAGLVRPHDADNSASNGDVFGPHEDRVHRGVGGLQPYGVALQVEALQRSLLDIF